jgi:hypothetical protein
VGLAENPVRVGLDRARWLPSVPSSRGRCRPVVLAGLVPAVGHVAGKPGGAPSAGMEVPEEGPVRNRGGPGAAGGVAVRSGEQPGGIHMDRSTCWDLCQTEFVSISIRFCR